MSEWGAREASFELRGSLEIRHTLLTRFNPNASQMNRIVDFEVEPAGAGDT